ncbi:hypothetical protein FH972_021979 [Carpinus fangiana]|uniref:Major facilitator superfamily (MFS) profile domain-containing protein n=1 Tax=Carpinus fangiana TaxID=176857 RepID=A0A5N6KRF6_9ROSI|nr:hypothetical protein FH972_021979 [Carpinus fangiana]
MAAERSLETLNEAAVKEVSEKCNHGPIGASHDSMQPEPPFIKDPESATRTAAVKAEAKANQQITRNADSEALQEERYTAFSKSKKMFIIVMSAFGGFISPLSGSIYLPALNVLSLYYSVSDSKINLSVTTYMILQGLTPMFIGDFGDTAGFRPAFIICFLVYVCANIGLATQSSYAALLVLRCLQSAGSSGTIALRNGQLASVLTPAERGSTVVALIQVFSLLAPAFAPLMGGALTATLGWRSIFWFLTILSGIALISYTFLMPETNRKIVGNGSVSPERWYSKSLLDHKQHAEDGVESLRVQQARAALPRRKIGWPNPWKSLVMIGEKDVAIVLLYNSIAFALLYSVMTAVPSLFQQKYGFDSIQIGYCYIPIGGGAGFAALFNGKFLNWNFRRVAKANGLPVEKKKGQDLRNFPIESARLGAVFPLLLVGLPCLIGYGWALERNAHLAAPLVLIFFGAFGTVGAFSSLATLLVDLYPGSASTVTGANNLVRSLLGAGATAVIDPMLQAMGAGWTYTLIACVAAICSPLLLVVIRKGPQWREERRLRLEQSTKVEAERTQLKA